MENEDELKQQILNDFLLLCEQEDWKCEKVYEKELDEDMGEDIDTDQLNYLQLYIVPPEYEEDLILEIKVKPERCGGDVLDIVIDVIFGDFICDDRKQALINEYILRKPEYMLGVGGMKFNYELGFLYFELRRTYREDMMMDDLKNILLTSFDASLDMFQGFRKVYTEVMTPKEAWDEIYGRYLDFYNMKSDNEENNVLMDAREYYSSEDIAMVDFRNIAKLNNTNIERMKFFPDSGKIFPA